MEDSRTEQIEKFLLGKMSKEERQNFESQIQKNEELATEVQVQRLELDALDVLVARDLRERVQSWKAQPTRPRYKLWPWSLLLLLILGIVVTLQVFPTAAPVEHPVVPKQQETPAVEPGPVKESPKKGPLKKTTPLVTPQAKRSVPGSPYLALVLKTYEKPQLISSLRNTEQEVNSSLFAQGIKALDSGNHQEALRIVEQMGEGFLDNKLYIKGHAYFGLKRYPEAAEMFHQLVVNQSISYLDAADWFELLSLFSASNNQNKDLEKRLDKIAADSNHQYQPQAVRLKQALSNIQ